jgi:hypothetical protein
LIAGRIFDVFLTQLAVAMEQEKMFRNIASIITVLVLLCLQLHENICVLHIYLYALERKFSEIETLFSFP